MVAKSKCEHVKDCLREEILKGTYPPGSKIPIEHELGLTYKVGNSSIREAITSLAHEGLLEKKQGKGTFVRKDYFDSIPSHTKSCRLGLCYGITPNNLELIKSCQNYVLDKGGILTVYNFSEDSQDPGKEKMFLELAEKEGFRGVALIPTPFEPLNTDLYRSLRGRGMKVALLGEYVADGDNSVTLFYDFRHAGYLAGAKMAMAGYKSVCIAHGNLHLSYQILQEGLSQAAKDFNLVMLEGIHLDFSMFQKDDTVLINSKNFHTLKDLPEKTGILATQNRCGLILKQYLPIVHRRTAGDLGLCVVANYVNNDASDISIFLFPAYDHVISAIDYLLDNNIRASEEFHRDFKAVFHDKGSL